MVPPSESPEMKTRVKSAASVSHGSPASPALAYAESQKNTGCFFSPPTRGGAPGRGPRLTWPPSTPRTRRHADMHRRREPWPQALHHRAVAVHEQHATALIHHMRLLSFGGLGRHGRCEDGLGSGSGVPGVRGELS
ncbi:hypothetical protein EJB05_51653 [Eragrostis curvula]|uniref:Uncharacterized protein n=2 Tax=Eragrostis curvula TaxID=38414 RepID=A0A5J9SUZ7_9POAL|nr:hypothetical protein EJB05_51653 [Eragrostis curvula]